MRGPLLALKDVGAKYGMSQVLNGIALTVGTGEAVALLGRNGVGKTTLLRTIVGLHAASTGSIAFGDDEVAKLPPIAVRGSASVSVPQGRGIFPQLTVAEICRSARRRLPDGSPPSRRTPRRSTTCSRPS